MATPFFGTEFDLNHMMLNPNALRTMRVDMSGSSTKPWPKRTTPAAPVKRRAR
jgi:hypothetical protein